MMVVVLSTMDTHPALRCRLPLAPVVEVTLIIQVVPAIVVAPHVSPVITHPVAPVTTRLLAPSQERLPRQRQDVHKLR